MFEKNGWGTQPSRHSKCLYVCGIAYRHREPQHTARLFTRWKAHESFSFRLWAGRGKPLASVGCGKQLACVKTAIHVSTGIGFPVAVPTSFRGTRKARMPKSQQFVSIIESPVSLAQADVPVLAVAIWICHTLTRRGVGPKMAQ